MLTQRLCGKAVLVIAYLWVFPSAAAALFTRRHTHYFRTNPAFAIAISFAFAFHT